AEPEIIRLYVPAKQTSKWFFPGTELRVMPVDEFESLVKRAAAGSNRLKVPEAPRLIRARHQARLSSGVLTGQSELIIASNPDGSVDYAPGAWSPAVLGATRTAARGLTADELPTNPFIPTARTFPGTLGPASDPALNSIFGAHDSGTPSIWLDRPPAQSVRLE